MHISISIYERAHIFLCRLASVTEINERKLQGQQRCIIKPLEFPVMIRPPLPSTLSYPLSFARIVTPHSSDDDENMHDRSAMRWTSGRSKRVDYNEQSEEDSDNDIERVR